MTKSHFDVGFGGFDLSGDKKAHDARTFAIIPVQALTDGRISHLEFRILAGYCSYMDQNKITFVGQKRIAADIGVDQSTVSRCVRKMRRLGFMGKAPRPARKYGGAQTHGIFLQPIKSRVKRDEAIEAAMAAQGAKGEAPPVSVSGLHTISKPKDGGHETS